jgi:hypothetical protein
LRETASATNAEERLYFFFPLRLCAFAGKTASATNAEERFLPRLSFAPLRETASQQNAEQRLYFVFPLRLWACGFTALRSKDKISEFNPRFLNTDGSKESRQFVAVERAIGAQTAANVNSERFYFLNSVGNVVRF